MHKKILQQIKQKIEVFFEKYPKLEFLEFILFPFGLLYIAIIMIYVLALYIVIFVAVFIVWILSFGFRLIPGGAELRKPIKDGLISLLRTRKWQGE